MTTHKYNPAHPSRRFGNMVDDLFGRSLSEFLGNDWIMSRPSVNVSETDNSFKIELAAPGLEKNDFEIKMEKDQIVISAKKESKTEEAGEKFTRREFNFNSFSRSFTVPENVDTESISAAYENGILQLTLPKVNKTNTEEVKKILIQ